MLFLLALSSSLPTAQAVSPYGGLAGGFYFTGASNPTSGRYLLHDPDRFPVVPLALVRAGVDLNDHWGVELPVGWMQGNTNEFGYGYTTWYPTIEAVYHILPPEKKVDFFAQAGPGFTHTKVNRDARENQSNDQGYGLYRNPSIDGLIAAGVGVKLHLVGPLYARTDVRDLITLGTDPTPDRSDIFNNFEWTIGLDLGAPPEETEPVPPPPPTCPDPDNDGLCGDADKCPEEPEDKDGFQDTDGCPDPDNDTDAILDVDDKCPNDPEDMDSFEDTNGCPDPDNDQDGIPDTKDKCPIVAENKNGYQDLDGCPDEIPKEATKFTGVIEGIYFDYDKDTIKSTSEKTLQAALAVLNKFPDLNLEVQGHTDSKGDDVYNMDLSQRRSEAVMKWFIAHGVAANRLKAVGYGETQPISTNETDAGRAKNRRVEFHPFSE